MTTYLYSHIPANFSVSSLAGESKPQVLVPGGAGFIGSHCLIELVNAGYEPIVIDNGHNSSMGPIETSVVVERLSFEMLV